MSLDADISSPTSEGVHLSSGASVPSRRTPATANAMLLRAWRNLTELRMDEVLLSLAKFDETAALTGPLRSQALAELIRAVLTVMMGRDKTALRAALSVIERHLTLLDDFLHEDSRHHGCMGIADLLSPRELSVLRSLSCGLSNKQIAQQLRIAPETVKTHVKGIFVKLEVQTRAHAVSTAATLGILQPCGFLHDALAPEKTSIQGPSARPEHCERQDQRGKYQQ